MIRCLEVLDKEKDIDVDIIYLLVFYYYFHYFDEKIVIEVGEEGGGFRVFDAGEAEGGGGEGEHAHEDEQHGEVASAEELQPDNLAQDADGAVGRGLEKPGHSGLRWKTQAATAK